MAPAPETSLNRNQTAAVTPDRPAIVAAVQGGALTAEASGGCSTLTAVGGRLAVCRVSGAVDRTGVGRFREAMVALAEHPAAVLDLSGAYFIDAAGLSAIAACLRRSVETGGEVVIVATRPHVVRLFDVIGISRLVPVVASTHDALRTLDRRAAAR